MRLIRLFSLIAILVSLPSTLHLFAEGNQEVSSFPLTKYQASEPGDNVILDFSIPDEFTVYVNMSYVDRETYSLKGDKIYIKTSPYCKPYSEQATYIWIFENNTLRFEVVGEDKCSERYDDFEYVYQLVED